MVMGNMVIGILNKYIILIKNVDLWFVNQMFFRIYINLKILRLWAYPIPTHRSYLILACSHPSIAASNLICSRNIGSCMLHV
jgi:hypothetical protein